MSVNKMERFSQRARQALGEAQREAHVLQQNRIEPSHLLLGLMQARTGVAAQVLSELNVEYDAALAVVQKYKPREAFSGQPELSAGMKQVLERSVDEARRMGHHYVGTEHLLFGLMRSPDAVVKDILERFHLSADRVRRQLVEAIQLFQQDEPPPSASHILPMPLAQERARVLEMLDAGKITAEEAVRLLNAMQVVAIPMPTPLPSAAMIWPAGVDPATLQARKARVVVRKRESGEVIAEFTLPLTQMYHEALLAMQRALSGATGKAATWDGEAYSIDLEIE